MGGVADNLAHIQMLGSPESPRVPCSRSDPDLWRVPPPWLLVPGPTVLRLHHFIRERLRHPWILVICRFLEPTAHGCQPTGSSAFGPARRHWDQGSAQDPGKGLRTATPGHRPAAEARHSLTRTTGPGGCATTPAPTPGQGQRPLPCFAPQSPFSPGSPQGPFSPYRKINMRRH